MKKQATKLFLCGVLAFMLGSCTTDNNNTGLDINTDFTASTDLTDNAVNAQGSSFFLTIKSEGEWSIEANSSWCTFNRTSGTGNATVMGTIVPNKTASERTIVISIVGNKGKERIEIKQGKGDGSQPEEPTDPEEPTKPDPEKPAGYAGRLEIPVLKGGSMNLFYTHTVNYNGQKVVNYSAEYDCTKKHPRWVAFFFDNVNSQKNTKRSDSWGNNPFIPSQYQTGGADYKGRYNRGHMVASSDRYLNREANVQTFYYSNMSPQITTFNGGIWNVMEQRVQSWGKVGNASDTLYVVKGGHIDGTVEDGTLIEYTGPNHVAVPRYYYMALLSLKGGQYKAMAFYINQEKYASSDISTYAISIDALEQKTGLDFFHNLPDNIESKVESTYNRSDWSL